MAERTQFSLAISDFSSALPQDPAPAVTLASDPAGELARCFFRLLPNYALDRPSHYEATLWRQAAQVLFALDTLDRRKPQDRRSHCRFGRGTLAP